MPQLHKIAGVSVTVREFNEDVYGSRSDAAWVIDGASSILRERLFPGASDGEWLAGAVAHEIGHSSLVGQPKAQFAATVLAQVISKAKALRPDLPGADQNGPAACICVARLHGTALELWNLGDCYAIVRSADGTTSRYGHSSIAPFDQRVVAHLVELQQRGCVDYQQAWPHLADLIVQNRSKANRTDGYAVLDLTMRGLSRATLSAVDPRRARFCLLVSDGFYRLVDVYHQHDDASLMDAAIAGDLDGLCARLRALETADPNCLRYPRIKPSDDATALLIRVDS